MADIQITYPKGGPQLRVDGTAVPPESQITLPVGHLLALVDAAVLQLGPRLAIPKLEAKVEPMLRRVNERAFTAGVAAGVRQERAQAPRRSEHVRQVVRDPATNLVTHLIDLE